ncbi:MAG TPA: carboxylating nicotinate-nucleotide diphosphorylase [Bacillota bacterium]|nr:carboxylating nicotinate-nucleotide diphosphorylase [Bacillota bacterium]HPT86707.1 carboxylating nicotinate-nucleotide diphosphorylase [Bacillota bacterium]
MNTLLLKEIIRYAINEDSGYGDITSEAIFDKNFEISGTFIAKADGIIAGLPVVSAVFDEIDPRIVFSPLISDGTPVSPGMKIATVQGPVKPILAGERIALNFLQRLSGIATYTSSLAKLIKDYPAKIVDTRKTTPGLRMLEKYAVRQGGGHNHRFNLSDAVLIKDNHIAACGSITKAIERCRAYIPHTMRIEVEVENETQVREALAAKADIIMLDNMTPAEMKRMVELINGQAIVEASGNVNEKNIVEIAATGVDIISIGSLTHSVRALDISLKFEG